MGYPMTWRRLVQRNGLGQGDYDQAHWKWRTQVNTNPVVDVRAHQDILDVRAERLHQYESAAKLLLGDIRRLEADSVDEGGICRHIVERTGIHSDEVAAVLKEFFAL